MSGFSNPPMGKWESTNLTSASRFTLVLAFTAALGIRACASQTFEAATFDFKDSVLVLEER
jgi:hypothetical protein